MGIESSSVCVCLYICLLSNMNIFATCGLITTKLFLKQHLGGGKAALGFNGENLVVIDLSWDKCSGHSSAFIFNWIFFILAGN